MHAHPNISHPHNSNEQTIQGTSLLHMHHMHDFKKRFIVSLIITIPIFLFSSMIQHWFGFVITFVYQDSIVVVLATVIYLYGGYPFLKMMLEEIRLGKPGMMTLISMAITVAYFYSVSSLFWYEGKAFFWELASLIDIMLIGHYIEAKSLLGASSSLNELAKLIPKKATKIINGSYEEIEIEKLKVGDVILVRPGEKIPSDGVIQEGEGMCDESFLTGESKPVNKSPSQFVYMGSTNLDGALQIEVAKSGKESYITQVIELVQRTSQSRSHTQDLANRAAGWLFYLAVSVAAVTFAVWALISSSSDAIVKTVTVLVIACPHALGLAVPLVTAISTSLGAENGILIRNRQAFEALGKVDMICFDKTGTITQGVLSVTDILALDDQRQLLAYAASLEQNSEHSIAKAIVAYAKMQGVGLLGVTKFENYAGIGAKGEMEGKTVMVGGIQLVTRDRLEIPKELQNVESHEESKVWIVVDGKVSGVILLVDTIRTDAKDAINAINRLGIKTLMLTGDNATVAFDVAGKVGIENFFAGLFPDEKLEKINVFQKKGKVVAMVGDGINDAPALLRADVGIAIAAGTDIAAQSADVILTKSALMDVVHAIDLSQKTYRKMVQNLWWASGYNIIAIPLAAGLLSPWNLTVEPAVGAILMSVSTMIVALNAQRLKKEAIQ